MNLDEARRLFFEEAADLLARMEELLLRLEQAPTDRDDLSALFRCAHTIKGSAGIFGFDDLVAFTHGIEAFLSLTRDGERLLDTATISTLLECRDHAAALLSAAGGAATEAGPLAARSRQLLERLEAPAPSPEATPATAPGPVEATKQLGSSAAEAGGAEAQQQILREYTLLFQPGRDVFRRGLDPFSPIRQLSKFAELTLVRTELELPEPPDFDPESCYLGLTVVFRTEAPLAKAEGFFDFFRSDSEIAFSETPPATAGAPAGASQAEAIGQAEAAASAVAPPPAEAPPPRAPAPAAAAAQGAPTTGAAQAAPVGEKRGGFVRVETTKLDRLINLVGELVIAGAHMNELAGRSSDDTLVEPSRSLTRMISDLRDQSLRVRMVPLAEAFARFHRAVRETALATGKEVRLDLRVGDSEMDKNLIEAISEPLLHIIRNAVDHGIESTADRKSQGKPLPGTVGIRSYRETGSIVLEIWDDGTGFRPEAIAAAAKKRGLIPAEAELSEDEALQLLFLPGFSTREQVTSISGRGVGMDVVQKVIESLRGSVQLRNRPQGGSLTRVRLPLTLAIIEGFLVRVGQAPYVIPMELVTECIEYEPSASGHESDVLLLRDEILPCVRPADLFGEEVEADVRENVVVVEYAERRAGLIVQGLLGEFQAVIKPLNRMFSGLRGVSGATILGDGSVALILDIPSLISTLSRRRETVGGAA